MLLIVDDKRGQVSLCGISCIDFIRLGGILSFARTHSCFQIRKSASELILEGSWIIDEKRNTISLLQLNWDQVFMLHTIFMSLHQIDLDDKTKKAFDIIVTAINAAVESFLRTEKKLK